MRKIGANLAHIQNFILFKSDLTEQQRLSISHEVGISWSDAGASRMEISQDFKSALTWFIHHKIGEALKSESVLSEDSNAETYLRLLGLTGNEAFTKSLGF